MLQRKTLTLKVSMSSARKLIQGGFIQFLPPLGGEYF